MGLVTQKPLAIRRRLVRRVFYRVWKSFTVQQVKNLIRDIQYESMEEHATPFPTIILSTHEKVEDFLILTHLFREHELILLAPYELPSDKIICQLERFNLVLRMGPQGVDAAFLKRLISTLKLSNRSVVVSPDAGARYVKNFSFDSGNFSRVAVKANAPIQPVVIHWEGKSKQQCRVFIGKRIFISPRHPDFKDIFFRRRDPRKFSKLSHEEFKEIGERIMTKFYLLKIHHGSNLS